MSQNRDMGSPGHDQVSSEAELEGTLEDAGAFAGSRTDLAEGAGAGCGGRSREVRMVEDVEGFQA